MVGALPVIDLLIHLCAIADLLPSYEILIGRELKKHRLKGVIVDLVLLIQDGLIRIGRKDFANEVIKVLQFVVSVYLAFNGHLCLVNEGSAVFSHGLGERFGLVNLVA